MGRQRATKTRKPKPKDESTEQDSSQQHPAARHRSSRSALLDLQRNAGNAAVSRLIQRQETSPQVRDALLNQSRSLIEDGLTKVPACVALASQLQSEAAQLAPGVAPNVPSAQALVAELTLAGTLLDSGISMYRQAGGNLSDVERLLKVRGYLSAALFYTNVVLSAPMGQMQSQVLTHVLSAQREAQEFELDEALRPLREQDAVAGPATQEETMRQQAQDILLQALYLGALGSSPAFGP